MSDWMELSLEDHELNYILKKFNLEETEVNRFMISILEKKFKRLNGGQSIKKYTKEDFYKFLSSELPSSIN